MARASEHPGADPSASPWTVFWHFSAAPDSKLPAGGEWTAAEHGGRSFCAPDNDMAEKEPVLQLREIGVGTDGIDVAPEPASSRDHA